MKKLKGFEVIKSSGPRRVRRRRLKGGWIWDYDAFYDLCEEIFDVMEEDESPNLNQELAHCVVVRFIGDSILREQTFHQLRDMVDMVLSLWSNANEIALSFEECDVSTLFWVGNNRYKYEYY